MMAIRETIVAAGLTLACNACHGEAGREITKVTDVPMSIVGAGSDLVVTTVDLPNSNEHSLLIFSDSGTLLATIGPIPVGTTDVDDSVIYHSPTASEMAVSAFSMQGNALPLNLQPLSGTFVGALDGAVYWLDVDFPPKLFRGDLSSGLTSSTRLPSIGDRYLGPVTIAHRPGMLYVADQSTGYTFRVKGHGAPELVKGEGAPISCFTATDSSSWWFPSDAGPILFAPAGKPVATIEAPKLAPHVNSTVFSCAGNSHEVFYATDVAPGITVRDASGRLQQAIHTTGPVGTLYADDHALYWSEVSQKGHGYSLKELRLPNQ